MFGPSEPESMSNAPSVPISAERALANIQRLLDSPLFEHLLAKASLSSPPKRLKRSFYIPLTRRASFCYNLSTCLEWLSRKGESLMLPVAADWTTGEIIASGPPSGWSSEDAARVGEAASLEIFDIKVHLNSKPSHALAYRRRVLSESKQKPRAFKVGQGARIGNQRLHMEDRTVALHEFATTLDGHPVSFIGVYDGHNGVSTAEYLSKQLHMALAQSPHFKISTMELALEEAILSIDTTIRQQTACVPNLDPTDIYGSGSTVCVVLIVGNSFYTANVGDSRAVLGRSNRALALTIDHNVENVSEIERLDAAGAKIQAGYVSGQLAITRAIGNFKKGIAQRIFGVSARPAIMRHDIMDGDEFIVVACDGVYDVLTTQETVTLARRAILAKSSPDAVAETLCDTAIDRGSTDNVSAAIVILAPPLETTKSSGRPRFVCRVEQF